MYEIQISQFSAFFHAFFSREKKQSFLSELPLCSSTLLKLIERPHWKNLTDPPPPFKLMPLHVWRNPHFQSRDFFYDLQSSASCWGSLWNSGRYLRCGIPAMLVYLEYCLKSCLLVIKRTYFRMQKYWLPLFLLTIINKKGISSHVKSITACCFKRQFYTYKMR